MYFTCSYSSPYKQEDREEFRILTLFSPNLSTSLFFALFSFTLVSLVYPDISIFRYYQICLDLFQVFIRHVIWLHH